MNYEAIFVAIGALTAAGMLFSLRREHIRTEYSVSWLGVGMVLVVLAAFPAPLADLAEFFHTDSRTLLLICAGILISALVFEISHVVSRLRDENVLMAQRVAILELKLRTSGHRNGETS